MGIKRRGVGWKGGMGGGGTDLTQAGVHSWSTLGGVWCPSLAASLHLVFNYFADPYRLGKIPLYVKNLVKD